MNRGQTGRFSVSEQRAVKPFRHDKFLSQETCHETSSTSNRHHSQHLRAGRGANKNSIRQRRRSDTAGRRRTDRAARLGAAKSARVTAQRQVPGHLRQSAPEKIGGHSAAWANGQARASRRAEELNAIRRRPVRFGYSRRGREYYQPVRRGERLRLRTTGAGRLCVKGVVALTHTKDRGHIGDTIRCSPRSLNAIQCVRVPVVC